MAQRFVFFIGVLLVWRGSTAETITEAVYLAALEAEHPAVMALEGPLAVARGEERSARALSNPVLEFDRETPGDVEQNTFGVGWTPPLDGRRGSSIRAARAGVVAAQSELDWTRLELRAEFRQAYADWALAAERVAVAMSQVAVFRDVVGKAVERKRVGEESGLTAQRLSLALVELEASAARAEAELAKTTALALGRTAVTYADPRPVLPTLPALPSELALQTHPLLRARRADADAAEARARSSRRFFITPELRAGWQTLHDGNQDAEGLVWGGAWSVPLFDRGQGERLAWEGIARASRGRLEMEEIRARTVLTGAEASYRRLRAAALSTAKALEDTDRIMEQAKARFQMGESDVTDLLDAMRSVLSSRMTGLELYAAALEAHRELELASGRALDEAQRGGR